MGPPRVSFLDTSSNGDRRLRDLIKQQQALGIITLLIGLSQVVLALSFIDPGPLLATPSSWVGFVLAAGGWMLIGIGMNVFQDRKAFNGWNSERVRWLSIVVMFLLTVGVAAGTVWVVLS